MLSFVANHNDAPALRQKIAKERAIAQAQEAVGVGEASPEEMSAVP